MFLRGNCLWGYLKLMHLPPLMVHYCLFNYISLVLFPSHRLIKCQFCAAAGHVESWGSRGGNRASGNNLIRCHH